MTDRSIHPGPAIIWGDVSDSGKNSDSSAQKTHAFFAKPCTYFPWLQSFMIIIYALSHLFAKSSTYLPCPPPPTAVEFAPAAARQRRVSKTSIRLQNPGRKSRRFTDTFVRSFRALPHLKMSHKPGLKCLISQFFLELYWFSWSFLHTNIEKHFFFYIFPKIKQNTLYILTQ